MNNILFTECEIIHKVRIEEDIYQVRVKVVEIYEDTTKSRIEDHRIITRTVNGVLSVSSIQVTAVVEI